MPFYFYPNIVSTISSEWIGFPHPSKPNHKNIDEVPGAPTGVPFTINLKNYNSDKRGTMDVYGVSFSNPLPWNATDIRMCIGARIRTRHHFGWFYGRVSLYNGTDHWYTFRKVLDPHQWTPVSSDIIEYWTNAQVNAITQIKLKADTNPIEVAALYFIVEFVYGMYIYYGSGFIYGTGWTYGLNPI